MLRADEKSQIQALDRTRPMLPLAPAIRKYKGYRRVFSRFEKLDVMFLAFICYALIADGLR